MGTRRKALRRKIESVNTHLLACKKYYMDVGKEVCEADEDEGLKFVYAYQAIDKMITVNETMLASM